MPKDIPTKAPPAPEDRLRYFASWVKSDRHLPPSAISIPIVQALLDAKLVTRSDLRRRRIAA